MSRKDDLQFLTTDLEYSDETPQAAAPLFPDEADDTFVGKLGLFKGSRHPGVALFHVLFKSLALAVYLFAGLFTSNFVLVCVVCILLLAFDFWTVKNVSGRLLVGLRWWNYVKEDGATEWVAENGVVVLEMAPSQTASIADHFTERGWHASIHQDLAGRDRAVVARKRG